MVTLYVYYVYIACARIHFLEVAVTLLTSAVWNARLMHLHHIKSDCKSKRKL